MDRIITKEEPSKSFPEFESKGVWQALLFLLLFSCIVIISNLNPFFNKIGDYLFVLTNSILGKPFLYYLILSGLILFFYHSSGFWRNLRQKITGIIVPSTLIVICFLFIFLLESILYNKTSVQILFESNTPKTLLNGVIELTLIGFFEEIIFKYILMNEIIGRVKRNKRNNVIVVIFVSIIFTILHIPRHIYVLDLNFAALIPVFVYGILSSFYYLKTRNLSILIALHFSADISSILLEGHRSLFMLTTDFVLIILLLSGRIRIYLNSVVNYHTSKINLIFILSFFSVSILVIFSNYHPKDYYELSRAYSRIKKFDKAEQYANVSLEKNINKAEHYYNRGYILNAKEKYQSAYEDLTKAIYLDNNLCKAYKERAYSADHLNLFKECVNNYTALLSCSGHQAEILNGRGNCYMRSGEYDKAQKDFEKALKLEANNIEAIKSLSMSLFKSKKFKKSVFYANYGLQKLNDPYLHEVKALSFTGLKEFDSALNSLNDLQNIDNQSKIAYTLYGMIFIEMDEYDSAEYYFKKQVNLYPNDARSYYQLSNIYYEQERDKEMCVALNKAAELGHEQAKSEIQEFCY